MNTKKLFLLLAAVLLSSVSAFAQSGNNEPLKGDVNGDEVVDVADIVAIIDIIKNPAQPQKTYYWYVGKSIPTSIGGSGWTSLGTDLSGISYIQVDTSNNPDYSYPTFYVIMPSTLQFKPYNSDGTRDESVGWTSTTWSVNNNYTLWTLNDPIDSINSRFKK